MRLNIQNGRLEHSGFHMDYIRFGSGSKVLIILPGLGDGLQSVKGTALPMALMYRSFAKEYTVYAFSRRQNLPQGCTTRQMAGDVVKAMDLLGISRADILAVSMGGMIAQFLAIDHPGRVGNLVLCVTSARPNPVLTESIQEWTSLAKQSDHTALMDSNLRKIYSEGYYRKNRWLVPLMGILTKPKSYERFLIQAEACLSHDAFGQLCDIHSPTLVVGGAQDRCLGPEAASELAARIPQAQLVQYAQWGHGLYEEAEDFNDLVLRFLLENPVAK